MQDLYHLEVVATVLEDCGALSAQLAGRHEGPRIDALALTEDMIALSGERWATEARFVDMAVRWRIAEVRSRILFHTQINRLMRRMPTRIFVDLECRFAVLAAAQAALDQAIEADEADGGGTVP
jgi:type III secretion protein W